jgi:hypothetical protein
MCWNASVSLAFAVAMFGSAYALKKMNYSSWKRAAFGLSIYGAMQFSQFLNWLTVASWSDYPKCSEANRIATYVSYIALNLQPLFNVLAIEAGEKRHQDYYRLAKWSGVVVAVAYFVQLVIGDFELLTSAFHVKAKDLSTIYDPSATCTYIGPGGYLLWKFKVYLSVFSPTYFVYHLFGLVVFTVTNKRHLLISIFGFYGLAIFARIMYAGSGEVAAYWCHTTVVLPLFFFADLYYERRLQKSV